MSANVSAAADRERREKIEAMTAQAGLGPAIAADLVASGVSAGEAQTKIFAMLKAKPQARKEFDANLDVHEKMGVSFDAFLLTFVKEQAEDSTAG